MSAARTILTVGALAGALVQGARLLRNVRRTKDYFWRPVREALAAGFTEKQALVRPGLTINYAEGPTGGVPLLLVPGQAMIWQDYAPVLRQLAQTYHVVVIDCHGHGGTSWNPEDYTAVRIVQDLALFIDEVFGEPCIASGHSSGGLCITKLAATHPEEVFGLVIEDAPFFSTEPARAPRTYAYLDTFARVPGFLAQTAERDWVCYYMPRSYWRGVFGARLWEWVTDKVVTQRREDPTALPVIPWLGVSVNRIWESLSHPYDVRFGQAFYDFTWFEDFDQEQTLRDVQCPTTFIKATTRHDKDGVLLAALSDEDCAKVDELLPDNAVVHIRSPHDVHFAHPQRFASWMTDFAAHPRVITSRERARTLHDARRAGEAAG